MTYTVEMPQTQLPTLAIKFAITVQVGLIQFDPCQEAVFRSQGLRDFAEVKDALVDIALMRAGISVDVGKRTSVNTTGTCKSHCH